jgi:hypothetical protein
MVKYTDEELKLFIDCYIEDSGERSTLESFKKHIVNDKKGIFDEVSNIPYEELPLHVNDCVRNRWYSDCVKTRLKIGR